MRKWPAYDTSEIVLFGALFLLLGHSVYTVGARLHCRAQGGEYHQAENLCLRPPPGDP